MSQLPEMDPCLALIRGARAGDADAQNELFGGHLQGLTAFVRLRLGAALRERETSQDLVQSVYREVLEDLDDFEYRGEASFRHWLFRRAENKIRDRARFWRREKRDPGREERISAGVDDTGLLKELANFSTPSRQLTTREEIERVETAFAQLPDDYREVILLARVVGLSHAELSTEMNRTSVATRTLLSRALARLATILETA
ncbi:MAG: RNA polymerase sigma-70 factor (subfamily 1) [Planctomycetota bacterium]|jgi:RNA polymerase sigma-70 factor (subfamily 1)